MNDLIVASPTSAVPNVFYSLRTRLTLVLWLASLAFFIGISVYLGNQVTKQTIENKGQLFLQIADMMATQLDRDVQSHTVDVSLFSRLIKLRDPQASTEEKQALLNELAEHYPTLAWIGLIGPSGTIKIARDGLLEGVNVAERDYFIAGISGEPFVGDVHDAKLLANLLPPPQYGPLPLRFVDVIHPVYDLEDDQIVGVLAAHLSWDWASQVRDNVLKPLIDTEGLEVILFNEDDQPLLGPDDILLGERSASPPLPDCKVHAGICGYGLTQAEDGTRYLTAHVISSGYADYSGLGWQIVVRQDVAVALAQAHTIKQILYFAGGVFFLFFGWLIWFLTGQLTRPLCRIARAARRIDAGEFNVTLQPLPKRGEVAELGHALSHLLFTLNAQQQALINANEELEQRVMLRTKELTTSQQNVQRILRSMQDGLIQTDAQGRILMVNEAVVKIFGYPEQALIGGNISRLIADFFHAVRHPTAPPDDLLHHSTLLDNRREVTGQRKNGRPFPLELSIVTLSDDDHGDTIIAVLRDISARRQEERAFTESNRVLQDIASGKELNAVLASIVEMAELFVPGTLGCILLVDHQAQCLRHGAAPHLPEDYNQAIDGLVYGVGVGSCGTAVATGKTVIVENVATHPYWAAFREATAAAGLGACWSIPVKDADDQVVAVMALYYPVPKRPTEMELNRLDLATRVIAIALQRHQHDQALNTAIATAQAANHAKGAFLANMSHEIRTPMNAIIGFSQLCLQTSLGHTQRDYINKVLVAANSLLNIINDILDFSKIDANCLQIEHEPFELEEVLGKLATLTAIKAEDKGLEMVIDTSLDVPPHLIGDALRLGQVLLNLVVNAIKFTMRGEVHVSVECREDTAEDCVLEFKVRDTGIGLSDEQITHLFQPFSQADTSTTRRFGGTGLGLTISRRLVQMMDGDIKLTSTPDVGSEFSFTAHFGKPAEQPRRFDLPLPDLRQLRVLVVDDNERTLEILARYLESFGFQVQATADPHTALRLLDISPYDLLITDWKMPGMDGIELASRARKMTHLKPAPKILLISSFGASEVRRHLHDQVVDDILPKPFLPSAVFDAIVGIFSSNHRPPEPVVSKSAQQEPVLHGRKILLVEDNAINQQLGQVLLQQRGAQVTIANDGQECLDWLEKATFDAVLMDMQMPVMDGLEATRAIRQQPRFRDLPIIAMTANALVGDRERCIVSGMNDYVAKPIDPEQLCAVLERQLQSADALTNAPQSPTPAQSPPAANPELPELPGLDSARALQRMGDNPKLYLEIVFNSREHFSTELSALQAILDESEQQTTARLHAHTIKGLAGNIGAQTLFERARALEQAISTAQPLDERRQLLQHVATEIAQLNATIDQAQAQRQTNNQEAPTAASVSPQTQRENFFAAKELLQNFDSQSREAVNKLCSDLIGSPVEKQARRLLKTVNDYDFEAGLDQLLELAAALGIDL